MPSPAKINVLEAYRLRVEHRLTYAQIGRLQGVQGTSVAEALQRFAETVPSSEDVSSFEQARTKLLTVTEERLIASVADQGSIDKASLLDRSRALKAVHGIRRLEEELSTQNVSSKMSLLISHADANLFPTPQPVVVEGQHADELTDTGDQAR